MYELCNHEILHIQYFASPVQIVVTWERVPSSSVFLGFPAGQGLVGTWGTFPFSLGTKKTNFLMTWTLKQAPQKNGKQSLHIARHLLSHVAGSVMRTPILLPGF